MSVLVNPAIDLSKNIVAAFDLREQVFVQFASFDSNGEQI